jgi:hypothetical protein
MSNPARPELNGRAHLELRCRRNLAGVVDYQALALYDQAGNPIDAVYDRDGTPIDLTIPVAIRRRCKDYQCCPRHDGRASFHTWTIYGVQNDRGVGEYITEELELRSAADLPRP